MSDFRDSAGVMMMVCLLLRRSFWHWIPAFAGMAGREEKRLIIVPYQSTINAIVKSERSEAILYAGLACYDGSNLAM